MGLTSESASLIDVVLLDTDDREAGQQPDSNLGSTDPSFQLLVQADKERSDARSERISEANRAIPAIMYWFMVLALALP